MKNFCCNYNLFIFLQSQKSSIEIDSQNDSCSNLIHKDADELVVPSQSSTFSDVPINLAVSKF